MNKKYTNSEKGQAIVYLALGLVVFLGFVALAIDGGMVLADRRHAQNAADAASLAGGGKVATFLGQLDCPAFFTCGGGILDNAEYAAQQRAAQNSFTIDNDLSDHNGVDAVCVNSGSDQYINVKVDIGATTQSNFLQLLFPNALRNQVEAVTRVFPGGPIGNNDAIVALNGGNCTGGNGVTVNGTGATIVNGGNIFSNGCIQGNGSKGSANVNGGNISGHYKSEGNITFNPPIQISSVTITPPLYYIEPPKCTAWYAKLPNTKLSGLYCMSNNLDFKPGDEGTDVTFYVPNGTVSANGNGKNPIKLSAPTTGTYAGLLIYVPNGGSVTINGDTGDQFHGLIYAPDSQVSLTGTANNIFYGQVVGWDVKVGGTNDMTVNYELCKGYIRPPSLELYK